MINKQKREKPGKKEITTQEEKADKGVRQVWQGQGARTPSPAGRAPGRRSDSDLVLLSGKPPACLAAYCRGGIETNFSKFKRSYFLGFILYESSMKWKVANENVELHIARNSFGG